MNLEIIYEDAFILAVNKPNNVVVHHAKHSRNVSNEHSLLQLIEDLYSLKVYPIHRLDRKTSGLIILAKNTHDVSKFQDLFTQNQIQKTYYGLVRGFPPKELLIDSPVKGRDAKVHKEALTALKTLENITLEIPVKPYPTSRYSLVELGPKTGRIHQLRVHMNKISHPLIGDPKYGDKNHNLMFSSEFSCDKLFLHAGKLSFHHPFLKIDMELKARFPEDWLTLFDEFSWENPIN